MAAVQRATGPSLGSICASSLVVAVSRMVGKSALIAKRVSPSFSEMLRVLIPLPGYASTSEHSAGPADVLVGPDTRLQLSRRRPGADEWIRPGLRRSHGGSILAFCSACCWSCWTASQGTITGL
jgi:hypothetical protein